MGRHALVGATLVDPELGAPVDETLLVEDGRIAGRQPAGDPVGDDWRPVPLAGALVAPGFIDVHFHGELFAAGPEEFPGALERASAHMLACGTTAFLATTVAWSEDALGPRVEGLAAAVDAHTGGAACLGLHLEGPWLSGEAPGAMATACLRPYRPERDREVLDRAGDLLRMVTLAPEIEGAGALLDELARRGAVAALGHSRADDAAISRGIASGLRHVTHLFNAMGPLHHRDPGVAGAVLAEDRLTCDLICDGHHVHPAMVRVAARALGERLLLITDRVDWPAGEAPGPPPREAGEPMRLADGTLAGSQLGQDLAVRNATAFAGLSLPEAVAAATLRPARLLGVEHERGTLRPGARADLAVLDGRGLVRETWVEGRPLWKGDPPAA